MKYIISIVAVLTIGISLHGQDQGTSSFQLAANFAKQVKKAVISGYGILTNANIIKKHEYTLITTILLETSTIEKIATGNFSLQLVTDLAKQTGKTIISSYGIAMISVIIHEFSHGLMLAILFGPSKLDRIALGVQDDEPEKKDTLEEQNDKQKNYISLGKISNTEILIGLNPNVGYCDYRVPKAASPWLKAAVNAAGPIGGMMLNCGMIYYLNNKNLPLMLLAQYSFVNQCQNIIPLDESSDGTLIAKRLEMNEKNKERLIEGFLYFKNVIAFGIITFQLTSATLEQLLKAYNSK